MSPGPDASRRCITPGRRADRLPARRAVAPEPAAKRIHGRVLPPSRYRHPGDVIRLIAGGLVLAVAIAVAAVTSGELLGPGAPAVRWLGYDPAGRVLVGLVQVAFVLAAAGVVAAGLALPAVPPAGRPGGRRRGGRRRAGWHLVPGG